MTIILEMMMIIFIYNGDDNDNIDNNPHDHRSEDGWQHHGKFHDHHLVRLPDQLLNEVQVKFEFVLEFIVNCVNTIK